MQDYMTFAKNRGVELFESGKCQFCGANTKKGVHECLNIFNYIFQDIDLLNKQDHIYRFFVVDAHALQHPEIHGRWSNHFHLTRLHLIFKYNIFWRYEFSPKLSKCLNNYKINKSDEYLIATNCFERGEITTSDIVESLAKNCDFKELMRNWALSVYNKWKKYHTVVDEIANQFLKYHMKK